MSTLVIGDIHGCWDELQALLDKVGPGKEDLILAVGDVVDRGQDSPRVLDFFRDTKNAETLRGNHEQRHADARSGQVKLGFSHQVARLQWGEKDYKRACRFMAELPLRRELPEARVVHAFWEPGRRPRRQRSEVLLGLPEGLTRLWKRYERPWYELYDGDKPIIVGHLDYLRNGEPFIYKDRVWALDTGCARGGALTGLLLPEFRIVRVKSKRKYWKIQQKEYRSYERYDVDDQGDLNWKELDRLLAEIEQAEGLPAGLLERRKRLRKFRRRAEAAMDCLLAHYHSRDARIQESLRAEKGFSALPADRRRRRYRKRAGGGMPGRLLLLAYKGRLGRRALRKQFKRPRDLIRFCEREGLKL
jgi:hypothetical protein